MCREYGHYANICPKNEEMKGNKMNIIICYNCGKNDHTLKDCRKKRKGNLGLKFLFSICYLFYLWGDWSHLKRMS